jgi:hypothetical protein
MSEVKTIDSILVALLGGVLMLTAGLAKKQLDWRNRASATTWRRRWMRRR